MLSVCTISISCQRSDWIDPGRRQGNERRILLNTEYLWGRFVGAVFLTTREDAMYPVQTVVATGAYVHYMTYV